MRKYAPVTGVVRLRNEPLAPAPAPPPAPGAAAAAAVAPPAPIEEPPPAAAPDENAESSDEEEASPFVKALNFYNFAEYSSDEDEEALPATEIPPTQQAIFDNLVALAKQGKPAKTTAAGKTTHTPIRLTWKRRALILYEQLMEQAGDDVA